MAEQKKIEPLIGEELTHRVKELVNLSKSEKAKVCGYYSITKNGLERVNMKQFLNALIDAEGLELDGNDQVKEHSGRSADHPISMQSNGSMDSNKIVKVKRANQSTAKTQPLSQPIQQQETEPTQQLEIEQPEQPVPVDRLESVAKPALEESVCGTGWSMAQLMNEFGGR